MSKKTNLIFIALLVIFYYGGFLTAATILCIYLKTLAPLWILIIPSLTSIEYKSD